MELLITLNYLLCAYTCILASCLSPSHVRQEEMMQVKNRRREETRRHLFRNKTSFPPTPHLKKHQFLMTMAQLHQLSRCRCPELCIHCSLICTDNICMYCQNNNKGTVNTVRPMQQYEWKVLYFFKHH